MARRTVYDHRQVDEEFARRWGDVEERSTERMEREAYRRAVDGWVERGIFEAGERVGEVRKYSDTLLIFMLKSRRPDVYRDHHTVEHTGSVEQRVKLDLSQLTNEQLVALEEIQPDGDVADRTDAG